MKLENRVALITGAGSGIGRAIAEAFAEEGAVVVVNDVDGEAAASTIEKLGAAGGRACAITADVSDSAQVRGMFNQVLASYGGVDILVNNAGVGDVYDSDKRAETNRRIQKQFSWIRSAAGESHLDITQEMTDAEWNLMIGVHLNGTFFCTREALKIMSRKNKGAIINMASVAGLGGSPSAPHYGAAKGGILGFTRSVAQEVASRNIRVNALCPGLIATAMFEALPPSLRTAYLLRTPMGRPGDPREVAAAALFLASDDSSYFTGQWFSPNGGLFIA